MFTHKNDANSRFNFYVFSNFSEKETYNSRERKDLIQIQLTKRRQAGIALWNNK